MSLPKTQGLFRLVKDFEIITSANSKNIGKLVLAASENYNDKKTSLFIEATVFGKLNEIISKYASTKGTMLYIIGRLKTDKWNDQDGKPQSKISMILESVEFLPKSGTTDPDISNRYGLPTTPQTQKPHDAMPPTLPGIDIKEEEIPF